MTHSAHLGVDLDLLGFLVLGLLGSVAHCVGMCAPFVMVVSRHYTPPAGRHAVAMAQAWYNSGRIITYVLLGGVAGALGHAVDRAGAWMGLQRTAAAVAGLILVAWALVALFGLGRGASEGGALFAGVARRIRGRVPAHPILIGMFLGLLPCGLLYSAVLASATQGGLAQGATAMALFGIGTAPALLGLSLADHLIGSRRPLLNRLSHAFVLVMGLWYLWRGLAA